MKKIFILIGSRNKKGNTFTFTNKLLSNLYEKCDIEYAFPQDYKIEFCDGSNTCFFDTSYHLEEDLNKLQNKITKSDLLIIGSPVYVHSMSADLKLIIERLAWWTHTLRLQGKPTVILSTCGSNGSNTVLTQLRDIITFMGGNVIAATNASQFPNKLNNEEWIGDESRQLCKCINKYLSLGSQSNQILEKVFQTCKSNILKQKSAREQFGDVFGELNYWEETGMINYEQFKDYLEYTKTNN
ncbi:TPA: NADPH-dependent oxidoreductase [Enterococcus faecalis]|nr:NADPH-dependent oxidoreductase [Enterococcus faecalis]